MSGGSPARAISTRPTGTCIHATCICACRVCICPPHVKVAHIACAVPRAQYGVSASAVARGWAAYVTSFCESIGMPLPGAIHGFDVLPGTILSSASPLVSVPCAVLRTVLAPCLECRAWATLHANTRALGTFCPALPRRLPASAWCARPCSCWEQRSRAAST